MHICFISLGNFTHVGAYLEYFKSAGHRVSFVSLSPGPDYGVDTYNVGFGRKYSASEGKWKYPASMLRARSLVRTLKPDVVHTHYATSGGLAGLVCGYHPNVVTAHGTDLVEGCKSKIWRPLLRAVFKHADYINVVSDDLKTLAVQLGATPSKIAVLTLGVDTRRFCFRDRPLISKDRPLKLVSTRRLEPVYDHHTTIDAFALLCDKGFDFEMTFVGYGLLQNELEQRTRDLGLEGKIRFMGGVDNSDLPAILHKSDVYLSSSLSDGTSICLMEAMASGVFPVVSRIKANSSWLEHGVDAFLHEVQNPEELAGLIMKVCDNAALVQNALRRNRRRVEQGGDRQKNMKRLEEIYRQLAGNS